MIPIYRYLEVVLFSMLNFLPFLVLAIYAFRRHLRFSYAATNIILVVMCVLQIGLGFVAAFSSLGSDVLSVISTVIYAGFLFFAIKDNVGRVVFVLLALYNVGNLVAVLAKCLEGLFFGNMALETYRWSLSVCMLILHLFITFPVGLYVRKYFNSQTPIHATCWNYLWVVPATFYLTWYYHLYVSAQDTLVVALDLHNALFLLFINLGAFAVYHISILLLLAQQKAGQLAQENHLFLMQKLSYENLQHRISEAQQAKHDVRHHVHLIREYLHSGKLQELDAYLDNYTQSLPNKQSLIYCKHPATNALLSYVAQKANDINAQIDIFVQLPETIALPETTLSVILGNLLENALDACREIPSGEKKITVRGKYGMDAVYFEVSNTYRGELRKNKSGEYLSTKAKGQGIGLNSVSGLVKARGGMMELSTDNGIFRVSILLPESENSAEN